MQQFYKFIQLVYGKQFDVNSRYYIIISITY